MLLIWIVCGSKNRFPIEHRTLGRWLRLQRSMLSIVCRRWKWTKTKWVNIQLTICDEETYTMHAIRRNLQTDIRCHIHCSVHGRPVDNWNARKLDTTFAAAQNENVPAMQLNEKLNWRIESKFQFMYTHGQHVSMFEWRCIVLAGALRRIRSHLMFSSIAAWTASQTALIFEHIIRFRVNHPIVTLSRFTQSRTLSICTTQFQWSNWRLMYRWIYIYFVHFDETFVQTQIVTNGIFPAEIFAVKEVISASEKQKNENETRLSLKIYRIADEVRAVRHIPFRCVVLRIAQKQICIASDNISHAHTHYTTISVGATHSTYHIFCIFCFVFIRLICHVIADWYRVRSDEHHFSVAQYSLSNNFKCDGRRRRRTLVQLTCFSICNKSRSVSAVCPVNHGLPGQSYWCNWRAVSLADVCPIFWLCPVHSSIPQYFSICIHCSTMTMGCLMCTQRPLNHWHSTALLLKSMDCDVVAIVKAVAALWLTLNWLHPSMEVDNRRFADVWWSWLVTMAHNIVWKMPVAENMATDIHCDKCNYHCSVCTGCTSAVSRPETLAFRRVAALLVVIAVQPMNRCHYSDSTWSSNCVRANIRAVPLWSFWIFFFNFRNWKPKKN